jgi:hypothetical protein
LIPVFVRTGFHPAVPAGDLGVGSTAVQFGVTPAKYAFQIGHGSPLRNI